MVNPVTPFQFPKNPSPVEPIAERLQRWSKLSQQLSEYTTQLGELNRSNSASHEKLIGLLSTNTIQPEQDAVLTEIPSALNKLHSDLKLAANKSATNLASLSKRFQQIAADAQSRAENVRTYSTHFSSSSSVAAAQKQSQSELERYQNALKAGDHKEDLYLLKSRLDRSLGEHVSQENKLLENYHTVQSLGAQYDSAIVKELHKAIKDLDVNYSTTGKVLIEFHKGVKEYVFKVNSEEEYDEFLLHNKQYFITEDVPARDVSNIQYEGQYSTAAKLVRKGTLERRTKYLRSFVPAEYILTLSTLYELKDGQRTLAIDLSDAELLTDHKHATDDKFVLYARQQESSSGKHHTWVFRSDDAQAWASDLGKITKAAPGKRHLAVFGSETYEPEATTNQGVQVPKSVDPTEAPTDTASTAAVASGGNSTRGVAVPATGAAAGATGVALAQEHSEPGAYAGEYVHETNNALGPNATAAGAAGSLPSDAAPGAPVSTSGNDVIGGSSSSPHVKVDAPVGKSVDGTVGGSAIDESAGNALNNAGTTTGNTAGSGSGLAAGALGGAGAGALAGGALAHHESKDEKDAFGEVPTTHDSSAIPTGAGLETAGATDKSEGVSALDGQAAPVAKTQSRSLSTALDDSPATETGLIGEGGLLSENSIAHANEPAAKRTSEYPRKDSAISPLDRSVAGPGAGAAAASGVPPIVTTASSSYGDDSASDISEVDVAQSPVTKQGSVSVPPAHSAAWQAQQDLAAFERKQSESAIGEGDADSTFSYDKKHRASTYTGEDFKPPGSDLDPKVERKLTQTYHKYETVDPSVGLARTENETVEDSEQKMQRRKSSVSIKRSASRKATASYGGEEGLTPLSPTEKTQTGSAKLFFGDDLPDTTSGSKF